MDNSIFSVNFEESACFSGIKFDELLPVSNTQVINILHFLSSYCKLDPLPTTILKKCFLSAISAITSIINSSLSSAQVPLDLEQDIVSPQLKSPNLDINIFNNYRPISHLPFLSEVLEVVAGQINKHLLINNLHNKFQSAYRTGFSTETALIKITDDILYALDSKSVTALIMIDMSAAFDIVDHVILQNRLSKCFGNNNTVLFWFKSYLSNRSQCISVNNCVSVLQNQHKRLAEHLSLRLPSTQNKLSFQRYSLSLSQIQAKLYIKFFNNQRAR